MTFAKKIAAGFGLALGALVIISGLSYWSTSQLIKNNERVEHTYRVLTELESLLSLMTDAETGTRGFLLTGDEAYLQPYLSARKELDAQIEDLRTLTADNANQQLALKELKPLIDQRINFLETTIQLRKKDKEGVQGEGFKEVLTVINRDDGRKLMDQVRRIVNEKMVPEERKLLAERSAGAEASGRTTIYFITIGTPVAILLALLGGALIVRSITNPVREVIGRLTSTSAELLAGTSQQAAGTQEQAAAVSQTVTTVDEVTQTAEQAAQRAQGVGETAQRTLEIGKAGRQTAEDSIVALDAVQEQVQSTAENILALAEQAQAISEIIATVNDITEQTNLLALNAAIEASRAGEHGRGFAVVAGEVKALADQSKKATVQVRQILSEIQKGTNKAVLSTEDVTKGLAVATKVTRQASETIKVLADTLAESAQAATQIVASAGQQATGMAQIHQAMRNIDQVTRQNVAATRQTEQAAQNLNELGTRLAGLFAQ
jgi:methyl-accepting chemotaxis protein